MRILKISKVSSFLVWIMMMAFLLCFCSQVQAVQEEVRGNTNANINSGGYFVNSENAIFFSNPFSYNNSGTMGIIKTDLDGSNKVVIINKYARNINSIGEWIYFTNSTGNITKVKQDGTELTQIGEEKASQIIVINDFIYYSNPNDASKIYKIKTDGTIKTKITGETSGSLNILGDWIYYVNSLGICKIKTDGNERQQIFTGIQSDYVKKLIEYENKLYFSYNDTTSMTIYSMNLDGTEVKRNLFFQGKYWFSMSYDFQIVDDSIYFIKDDLGIYKSSLNGDNVSYITHVSTSDSPHFYVINGWIYFSSYLDDPSKTKDDGSETWLITPRAGAVVPVWTDYITSTAKRNSAFMLPSKTKVLMSDNSVQDKNIIWANEYVDTSKVGRFDLRANIENAAQVYVRLTLNVVDSFNVTGIRSKTISSSEIDLTWTAVTGATSYNVYRSTAVDGTYNKIRNVLIPEFTDNTVTSSTTYYYKISATYYLGESDLSDPINITTLSPPKLCETHVEIGTSPDSNNEAGLFIGLGNLHDSTGTTLTDICLTGYSIEIDSDPDKLGIFGVTNMVHIPNFSIGLDVVGQKATINFTGNLSGDLNRLLFIPLRLSGSADEITTLTIKFLSIEANSLEIPDPITLSFQRGKILNDGTTIIALNDAVAGLQYLAGIKDDTQINVVNMASILPDGNKPSVKNVIALIQNLVGLRDDSFQLVSQ